MWCFYISLMVEDRTLFNFVAVLDWMVFCYLLKIWIIIFASTNKIEINYCNLNFNKLLRNLQLSLSRTHVDYFNTLPYKTEFTEKLENMINEFCPLKQMEYGSGNLWWEGREYIHAHSNYHWAILAMLPLHPIYWSLKQKTFTKNWKIDL